MRAGRGEQVNRQENKKGVTRDRGATKKRMGQGAAIYLERSKRRFTHTHLENGAVEGGQASHLLALVADELRPRVRGGPEVPTQSPRQVLGFRV